jgi:hypothetical protein
MQNAGNVYLSVKTEFIQRFRKFAKPENIR